MYLIAIFSLLTSMTFMGLQYVPSLGQRIRCHWINYNRMHQIHTRNRVDSYVLLQHGQHQCLLNDRGQASMVALGILIIVLTFSWVTLSFVTEIRQKVLYREQILSCTSFLEKKSLELNEKIETINKRIKSIRLLELTSRPVPAVAATLQGTRTALEIQQQHYAFQFMTLSKLPFKQCQSYFSSNLMLYKHQLLILQRDQLWRTAIKRHHASAWLRHNQNQMQLSLQRSMNLPIISKRYLLENSFSREKPQVKGETFYGSI